MKYKLLLQFLRLLIYGKRVLWWGGKRLYRLWGRAFIRTGRLLGYAGYRLGQPWRRLRLARAAEWWWRRAVLQTLIFFFLLALAFPHTRWAAGRELAAQSRNAIAYRLLGNEEEYITEEVTGETTPPSATSPSWRQGTVTGESLLGASAPNVALGSLPGLGGGGGAVVKPMLMPGSGERRGARLEVITYVIEPGDSLGSIAADFNVSLATLLWENNLTLRSILRPGTALRIPPVSGVRHAVRKGDTVKKIAARYGSQAEDIITFNRLKPDGSDLKIGEKIMVPGGTPPLLRAPIQAASLSGPTRLAAPPASAAAPSVRGFVWPAASRLITQYFHWRHNGLDISGPWHTSIYAARSGVVELARCGWNGGYGCYLIINHGGGLKTLYGHNARLLVTPGEEVATGQTVALMGNTGNTRGRTGIHVHFEVIVNGRRVNPLRYVR